jgi:hypothetical protein
LKKAAIVILVTFAVLILSMLLSTLQIKPVVYAAHTGSPINSGWAFTPPVINGIISPGEWSTATVVNFTLQMRSRTDGSLNRTLNGQLFVENNYTDAFLAVQIFNDDYEAHDFGGHYKGLAILFNDNDNGTLVIGDNGEGVTTWTSSPFYSHNDLYYAGGYWDSIYDLNPSWPEDGVIAWSHTNETQGAMGNWTFEMMIPLVGPDAGYDFNITSLPYTVGYKLWFEEPGNGLDGVYPYDPTVPISFDQTTNASTFGDMTFYPLYNLTMVATTGGTTSPAPGISSYAYNTVVSATATANPWYQFDHWVLDGVNVGSANPYSVTMNQNHTLEAVFVPLYALNITATAGGTTTPVPGVYVYVNGTVVPVTATANPWYQLDYWVLDGVNVGSANPYSVTMNQNHTLEAVFVPLYALNITATAGGTTTPVPGVYVYVNGTVVPVTATANPWYQLDYWVLDGVNVGSANPYSVTMNQNHTLEAVFVPLYALNITATAGGTTTPAPGVHVYVNGTVVPVMANANAGYQFDYWVLDSVNVGSANPYSVTMLANHTLNAVFVPLYNLTIIITGGGSTAPAAGIHTYASGTNVSVTATANVGYVFDHWELDGVGVGSSNPYYVLMNQNHVLNATFVLQLSVTISPAFSTIFLGKSVMFTSIVTGGTAPYSYQWVLVPSPVGGATSSSWMFTPASLGMYYVYLNVTDSIGRVAMSNTATVVVIAPVGGYSVSYSVLPGKSVSTDPMVYYGALTAALCVGISFTGRKKKMMRSNNKRETSRVRDFQS